MINQEEKIVDNKELEKSVYKNEDFLVKTSINTNGCDNQIYVDIICLEMLNLFSNGTRSSL